MKLPCQGEYKKVLKRIKVVVHIFFLVLECSINWSLNKLTKRWTLSYKLYIEPVIEQLIFNQISQNQLSLAQLKSSVRFFFIGHPLLATTRHTDKKSNLSRVYSFEGDLGY